MANLASYKKTQQSLSTRYARREPISPKEKVESLIATLLLFPFVLSVTFLSRIGNSSLQPILAAIIIGLAWSLFFLGGHRPISKDQVATIFTEEEQQQRLLYDSMWHYLYRSGLGFYSAVALGWGLVEFGIARGQVEIALLLVAIDLVIAVIFVINRHRMVLVLLEGFRKHRQVGVIVGVVLGLFSVLPALCGVANMIRVTTTQESRDMLVIPFMFLFNLFPLSIFAMTVLGVLITIAHYRSWRM